MVNSRVSISYREFVMGDLNSLTWYDLGVCRTVEIAGVPDLPYPLHFNLSKMNAETFRAQAQALSAQLLTGAITPELAVLKRLAFQTSTVMSRELCTTGDRALRMWAQRLNYALQPLITEAEPEADLPTNSHEEVLDGQKPWDALRTDDALWWISSDPENLHCRTKDDVFGFSLDMPTQIDRINGDGTLCIGSLYSNGATLVCGEQRWNVAHDAPVLLVFDWAGQRNMLDGSARIWNVETRKLVYEAPCQQVHFARNFGHVSYLMNNGDFGHITLLNMETGETTRQPVLPVQVCNDIAVTENTFYLIDKQQGSIFAFDREWKFRDKRLSFGFGKGQLSDPVSLRETKNGLACVSWLSNKLTEISLF